MRRALRFAREHPLGVGGGLLSVLLMVAINLTISGSRAARPVYVQAVRTGDPTEVLSARLSTSAEERPEKPLQKMPAESTAPKPLSPPKKVRTRAPMNRTTPEAVPTASSVAPEPPAEPLRLSAVVFVAPAAPSPAAPDAQAGTGWMDGRLEGGAADGFPAVVEAGGRRFVGRARGVRAVGRIFIELQRAEDGRPVSGWVAAPDGRPGVPAECRGVRRAEEIFALLGTAGLGALASAARTAALGSAIRENDFSDVLSREALARGADLSAGAIREGLRRGEFCIARPQPVRVFIGAPEKGDWR